MVRVVGVAYPLIFGTVGRLSQRNALRNPRRTGATAAALMIGLSLVGATAVLAASLTTSINAETDATFGADYLLTGNGQSPVSAEIIDKARAVPGIDAVTRQRYALAHASTSWATPSVPASQSSWPPGNGPARSWRFPPPGSTRRPSGSTRAR